MGEVISLEQRRLARNLRECVAEASNEVNDRNEIRKGWSITATTISRCESLESLDLGWPEESRAYGPLPL